MAFSDILNAGANLLAIAGGAKAIFGGSGPSPQQVTQFNIDKMPEAYKHGREHLERVLGIERDHIYRQMMQRLKAQGIAFEQLSAQEQERYLINIAREQKAYDRDWGRYKNEDQYKYDKALGRYQDLDKWKWGKHWERDEKMYQRDKGREAERYRLGWGRNEKEYQRWKGREAERYALDYGREQQRYDRDFAREGVEYGRDWARAQERDKWHYAQAFAREQKAYDRDWGRYKNEDKYAWGEIQNNLTRLPALFDAFSQFANRGGSGTAKKPSPKAGAPDAPFHGTP